MFEGRDLACIRGDRVIFEGLDFTVAEGTALWLKGPNGSGKSSLLRPARRRAAARRPPARITWHGAPVSPTTREAHHARLALCWPSRRRQGRYPDRGREPDLLGRAVTWAARATAPRAPIKRRTRPPRHRPSWPTCWRSLLSAGQRRRARPRAPSRRGAVRPCGCSTSRRSHSTRRASVAIIETPDRRAPRRAAVIAVDRRPTAGSRSPRRGGRWTSISAIEGAAAVKRLLVEMVQPRPQARAQAQGGDSANACRRLLRLDRHAVSLRRRARTATMLARISAGHNLGRRPARPPCCRSAALFQADDHDDGSLELIAHRRRLPLEVTVLAKCLAHWLTTGLPLVDPPRRCSPCCCSTWSAEGFATLVAAMAARHAGA